MKAAEAASNQSGVLSGEALPPAAADHAARSVAASAPAYSPCCISARAASGLPGVVASLPAGAAAKEASSRRRSAAAAAAAAMLVVMVELRGVNHPLQTASLQAAGFACAAHAQVHVQ